ncbi:MAG TPA: hypothetical protein VJU78_09965 [Chitinophagaceae bacterium]|nr:hypothetical protein [Chitinophagaceae bacterium]
MSDKYTFAEFSIEKIHAEREVNFNVYKDGEYLCRLVPGYSGFEISPMDKALGNDIDLVLLSRISEFIQQKDA